MRHALFLVMTVGLLAAMSGCTAYVERRDVAYAPAGDGYWVAAPAGSYRPVKTYRSQYDYYRSYNGING